MNINIHFKEKISILTHVHFQGIVRLLKMDVRLQLIVQIFIRDLQLMTAYSRSLLYSHQMIGPEENACMCAV